LADPVYEGMFLLDSNRYGRDPEGVSGQIPAMIEAAGGEVLVSRMWEERRLAYSIKGRRKGTYWLTYFRLGGRKLADLKRQSQLNDNLLRVLFIKIDPRIVETLVEHAQAGTVKPASDRTAERRLGLGRKEAGPAKKEAGPAKKEAGPAEKEAGPAEKEAGPAEKEAAATEGQDAQQAGPEDKSP
jgi:small subunit ribosomal protein S6